MRGTVLSKSLAKIFFGSSLISFISTGINLLITILVVRLFGSDTYARYIVDLSIISLLLICLELVPSNYSVFRIQDDPMWQRSISAQMVLGVIIIALIVNLVGYFTRTFQAYSGWMAIYAASMALKRYFDIRLQSTGRLREFMGLELVGSFVRLALLCAGYLMAIKSDIVVWASMGIAVLVSQGIWLFRNPDEFRVIVGFSEITAWRALVSSFSDYIPYYWGIILKRVKDNLVPLAAERLFSSSEQLAMFFLAYRGVIFAVGQIRILEAILNHRESLNIIQSMSLQHRYLIAFAAQILCIIASLGLIISSGLSSISLLLIGVLSFIIWPITFLVMERANAYSSYNATRINNSIIVYMIIFGVGAFLLKLTAVLTAISFSGILIASEIAGYIMIKRNRIKS